MEQSNADIDRLPTNDYKEEIRMRFIFFVTRLQYLLAVFTYAEGYRTKRLSESYALIRENIGLNHIEVGDKLGKDFLNEHIHNELFFKFTILQSLFVTAYSIFELQLRTTAEILEKNSECRIKIKDIGNADSDLDKLRKYLDLVHNIQSAQRNSLWERVNQFREIRNIIVHHGGRIGLNVRKRKESIDFLLSYNVHVSPEDFEFQIREDQFLKDFVDLIKTYAHTIVKEVAPVPDFPVYTNVNQE